MDGTAWTPELALGHEEIDAQHRELFERTARLSEALSMGDGGAVVQVFEFLDSYVALHHAAEERLMLESQFPGYNVHRAMHQRFFRDYQSLRELHQASGANAAVAVKAHAWLSAWLKHHVGNTDQQLARHLQGRVG